MKKGILILICFCCIGGLCDGQNKKIDSLLHLLKTAMEDTSKVNTFNALAKQFSDNNPDTAVYFANQAQALAIKLNYKMGIIVAQLTTGSANMNLGKFDEALKNSNYALKLCDQLLPTAIGIEKTDGKLKILKQKANALNSIGRIYSYQGNYPEALKNHFASLIIREEIGDKHGIAGSYGNIGITYTNQGNQPEGLKNFLLSLKTFEEIRDKKGISQTYNNIGIIYKDQGNYDEALKNYLASLKIKEEIGDKAGCGVCYGNIGEIYHKQGNYHEALKNFFASLKIGEEMGNRPGIAGLYNNIGVIYEDQKNYPEALKNYFAALKIREEIGDKRGITSGYINIGTLYTKQKKNNEASQYLNKALSFAKQTGSLEDIKESYDGIAALDSTQGNFKQAFENYKMYITYRDSLENKETTKKTMHLQMQYEFDKKESLAKAAQEKKDVIALKELQGQKLLKYFLFGGIGLLLVLFFFVYRTYRARQLLRLNDIRNKIASDLHDDIGSTLNSISIYSEVAKKNDEKRDEALEMIGDAARKVIDAMSDIVWTINSENDSFEKIIFRMKSLAYNLFNAKKIEFTFDTDETLNAKKLTLEERRNFYLIFKEAVNNLVKYSGARCAAITLDGENDRIRLHIQDDGIGFDISTEKTGNGLKNMKRRADEMKAEFTIESQIGGGTRVELILNSK